jgi:hypothetical protein
MLRIGIDLGASSFNSILGFSASLSLPPACETCCFAPRICLNASIYLQRQQTGAERIDLNGDVAGVVTADEAADAQQQLTGVVAKRKPKPARVEPTLT